MKKIFTSLFLIMFCLILVGCGNDKKEETKAKKDSLPASGKLSCTKEDEDDHGYIIKDTVTINYENKKISEIVSESTNETSPKKIAEDVDTLNRIAEKLNTIEGIEAVVTKISDTYYQTSITIDYTKCDINKINETLGEDIEKINSMLIQDNVEIDDFKSQFLEDYTCK